MLEEIKLINPKENSSLMGMENYNPELLMALGEPLTEGLKELTYSYRDHKVTVKGIPEDFRIFLGDQLVCEVAYGNVYNDRKDLVDILLK